MNANNEQARLNLSLLENGLDFLASAVEHLRGDPAARQVKYGLLHLAAGVELLLKERLRQEDWRLLFQDVDDATENTYASGDFLGVNPRSLMKRLRNAGVKIDNRQGETLALLRRRRNQVQHFAAVDTVDSALALTARGLAFALDFIADELELLVAEGASANYLGEIRDGLAEFGHFVSERRETVRLTVEQEHATVVLCLLCGEDAAKIDVGVRCLFCGYTVAAEAGAEAYAEELSGITRYQAVKEGGRYAVSFCPACELETLVDAGTDSGIGWFCLTCGESWGVGALSVCPSCGEFYEDNGGTICNACFDYRVSKD